MRTTTDVRHRHQAWLTGLVKAVVFFATALAVFAAVRLFFFGFYKADQAWSAQWPAILLGLRIDAKWFSLMLIPAWLAMLLALVRPVFGRIAAWLALVALAIFVLADLVNFGFYGFYMTPISALVFGLAQDDTAAIIATIWRDWPVVTYVVVWGVLTTVPWAAARFLPVIVNVKRPGIVCALCVVAVTLAMVAMGRGSFGTFPLRQQDLIVGPDPFINATVTNGIAALNEANKTRKALELKGGVTAGLNRLGFATPEEALSTLERVRGSVPEAQKPARSYHVIVALMEGMGRTEFEMDGPGNDMLGALRNELQYAKVFVNGVSSTSGTFPSTESLLFDTPYTPISQSRYGTKRFPFSQVLDFKKAGYKTVFLTSGTEKWRNMDENFPRQGFDAIVGAGAIRAKFPKAQMSTWGVGDRWTFQYARELIDAADKAGEKLFLVILSVTNHPPHAVPDEVVVNPVTTAALPAYVKDDRNGWEPPRMLATYQYAASALGDFVRGLREAGLLTRTVMAATGDHNTRWKFESAATWYCIQSVPVIFWLPSDVPTAAYEPERWVGHRDILPTMKAIALGMTPSPWQGRNVFSDTRDGVYAFSGVARDGFAIARAGAVGIDGVNITCFDVSKALISETKAIPCTAEQKALGAAARAQRALTDYVVRLGVLQGKTP